MFKKFGDSLLTGLGAVILTREKIEETTRKLVDKGKLTRDEAQKLNDELYERGESQWKSVETSLADRIQSGRDRFGLCSKEDHDALTKRVDELESKVAMLTDAAEKQQRGESKDQSETE